MVKNSCYFLIGLLCGGLFVSPAYAGDEEQPSNEPVAKKRMVGCCLPGSCPHFGQKSHDDPYQLVKYKNERGETRYKFVAICTHQTTVKMKRLETAPGAKPPAGEPNSFWGL